MVDVAELLDRMLERQASGKAVVPFVGESVCEGTRVGGIHAQLARVQGMDSKWTNFAMRAAEDFAPQPFRPQ